MDWDNDKKLDIISGCYSTDYMDATGHIQFLKGNGEMDFSESTSLLSSAGKPLENVKLKNGAEDDNMESNICTQQHAVDYDGDGDLDLVVGCFGANFFLYENSGKDGKNSLSEFPIELPLKSNSHHSAPHLADWDNDGDLDFLSGSATGGVLYSENTGTRQKPVWSEFKQLVAPPEASAVEQQASRISMGQSTRVWATDFNGDGLLDLLVGDCVNVVGPAEGVSVDVFKKKLAEQKQKMKEITLRQAELMESDEPDEIELGEISQQFMQLYGERDEFMTSKGTGHVWLLIRKADGTVQVSAN